MLNDFSFPKIDRLIVSDGQTKTGDNDKYIRNLWEVDRLRVGKNAKWALVAKGGDSRKWYGNITDLIDWSVSARVHFKKDHVARIAPEYIWFRQGICWNHIATSKGFAARLSSLAKRQISFITSLWKYNPIDFLERRAYLENEIKPICEQWFEKLPDVYHEFYNKVFENNMKYIFSREIEYCIDDNKDGYLTVIANARVYVGKNNSLDITYKKPISKDFSDDDVQRGLIHIQSGELFGASLMNRIPTLYYDGIRCFLYQGICDALELKCEGININHRRERLFN